MKKFDIPNFYRSPIIGTIKKNRRELDPKKKDFSPTIVDFGPVQFHLARHFGFCYGVENAIEISYRAIEENPNKKIYLLSQMIHNPTVNDDLLEKGLKFIMDTQGNQLISWDKISSDDIVITPAFGTTIEIQELLENKGVILETYDTTCPFVTRVWKISEKIAKEDFTIIIHGKYSHEETRATFSHTNQNAPSVIIRDMGEAKILAEFISGKRKKEDFYELFKNKHSEGFDPENDLVKIGVINQTTMLASETEEISEFLKSIIINRYTEENYKHHFADTRNTLCYATDENQKATFGLLKEEADLAIVVGGYNSSNTSHLVELCEEKLPTYFIKTEEEILSQDLIQHFHYESKEMLQTHNFLPEKDKLKIILTSGASCPDAIVDKVLQKLLSYFKNTRSIESVLEEFTA